MERQKVLKKPSQVINVSNGKEATYQNALNGNIPVLIDITIDDLKTM